MPNQGFLYVAFGDQFVREAETSARSLREVDPNAHITVITDTPVTSNAFDKVQSFKEEDKTTSEKGGNKRWNPAYAKRMKAFQQTPYNKTFFIDTDTFFFEPCSEVFQLLDYFDVLVVKDPKETEAPLLENGDRLEGCHSFNCGVIVYRKSEQMDRFFHRWLTCYRNHADCYYNDQQAFTEALLYEPVRAFALHNIYNLRTAWMAAIPPTKVKIVHGRHNDYRALEQVLNGIEDHRVWVPGRNQVIPWNEFQHSLLFKLYDKLPLFIKNIYRKFKS